ncbi:MAG: hypothetical protein OEZ06_02850 [Myxococcales bacterium]|nr:hypothetical protein [Myxococcales bacterium]
MPERMDVVLVVASSEALVQRCRQTTATVHRSVGVHHCGLKGAADAIASLVPLVVVVEESLNDFAGEELSGLCEAVGTGMLVLDGEARDLEAGLERLAGSIGRAFRRRHRSAPSSPGFPQVPGT